MQNPKNKQAASSTEAPGKRHVKLPNLTRSTGPGTDSKFKAPIKHVSTGRKK
jgi:hypothetical protein